MEKISLMLKVSQVFIREKLRSSRTGQKRLTGGFSLSDTESKQRGTNGVGQTGTNIYSHNPCGHIVRSSYVVCMVNQCLRARNLDFSCPVCGETWDWVLVRSLIQLSPAQMAILDKQVDNLVQDLPEFYKKCPVCCSILRRPVDGSGRPCLLSSCSHCTQIHHFCWACQAPWVFPNAAASGQCSNRSCHLVATLLSCGRVTDTDSIVLGCPLFRACPRCHTLITHTEGCKYVACPQCAHTFCFICLETKDDCLVNGDYHAPFCVKPRAERQRFVTF